MIAIVEKPDEVSAGIRSLWWKYCMYIMGQGPRMNGVSHGFGIYG